MAAATREAIWEDVQLKTTCYGCPAGTCGMIARRVNGVIVKVDGDPECPFSLGRLCAKGQAQIMMAYSRRRVTRPLKRTNPEKGIGVDPGWVEIDYDEAVHLCAEKLRECRAADPSGLVFATSDFTTLPWFLSTLLYSFGSPNHTSGGRAFCGNNVHPALQQVHGGFHATPDFSHTNYVMLIGSNKGAMSNWAAVTSTLEMSHARSRGMKVVAVDPWCSNSASVADEWVPIRPGTDGALMLGMINVLVNELGLYDKEFLRRTSNGSYLVRDADGRYVRGADLKPLLWDTHDGRAKPYDDPTLADPSMEGRYTVDGQACRPAFELVREHLRKYSPEYVAEVTTVPAETIRRLAHEFGTAASIGSTIEIDGHTLPLRPACAHWYKGPSQHTTGYEQGLAIAMLNTIVGAIDVPGGLSADTVYAHHPQFAEFSTWLGRDSGMREVDGMVWPGKIATYNEAFQAPFPPREITKPISMAADALAPVGSYMSGVVSKINALEPDKFKKNVPHSTGVYLQVVSNDLLNEGNPKRQGDFLRKFAFQISIVPNIDETAEFADIIIPTQTQLERLDFGANCIPDTMGSTATGEYCINLRQPVVDSTYKHFVDIWSDLAEATGILADLNQALNLFLELREGYRIGTDRKYDYRELTDRWIRSMTDGARDLDDVAKEGRIRWKKTAKERYPRAFYRARIPIYFEYFIDTGERLGKVTREMGLEWDLSRYRPLLDWYPGLGYGEPRDGYDLYAVSYKWPFLTGTFSNFNPWLAELSQFHRYSGRIVLNRRYAQTHGIRDGDRVRMENRRGRVEEGIALLTECIHPECVGIDHAGGNWAKSLPPRRKSTGVHLGNLLEYDMKNIDVMDGAFEASPRLKITHIG